MNKLLRDSKKKYIYKIENCPIEDYQDNKYIALNMCSYNYQRMRDMAIKMMRSIGDFAMVVMFNLQLVPMKTRI